MRRLWYCLGGCSMGLLLLIGRADLRAAEAPDPLRLVPAQADLVIQVPQPRQLIEAFTTLDALKQLQKFEAVQEFYDSTNWRRFQQLVAYYEKQFDLKWPELLDRLAGGGVVIAVKLGPNPAPSLLVVQGRDAELMQAFVNRALEVIEQELARQDSKDRPQKASYRDIETIRIGDQVHAAVVGSALLVANSEKVLRVALDLHLDAGKNSLTRVAGLAEARKLLPPGPLASLWLNMETIRKAPQANQVFTLPRNDANLTVLFGGLLDVAGRSPFLCAGFYRQPDGFLTTIRMPRGREGIAAELSTHVPAPGQPGSLPLLEPRGVLYSSSYFFDMAKFWENRAKLFNDKQVKGLEEFDKNSGRFLLGNRFSQLLTQTGTYQRIVVAHQARTGYAITPTQRIPAFAVVQSLREPETFTKAMNGILRSAALLARFQVKLKLVEEKHGDHTIVGYRFPEEASVPGDVNNVRFNFSPCFVRVGDQFVLCSTLGLCHELVDLLEKQASEPPSRDMPVVQSQLYAAGGADALKAIEDQLLAQTILDRAMPPETARQQVRDFIDWVRRLGVLRIENAYGEHDFRYDIGLQLGK